MSRPPSRARCAHRTARSHPPPRRVQKKGRVGETGHAGKPRPADPGWARKAAWMASGAKTAWLPGSAPIAYQSGLARTARK
eukprot:13615188-Alexandrium_andersonii.AAC.1